MADGGVPLLKQLRVTNPAYDALRWSVLRFLYSGDCVQETLQSNARLAQRLFPKHEWERPETYKERVARLHYLPYLGQILDHIVASLFADPLELESDVETDPFYEYFFDDVTAPGAAKMSLNQLMRKQISHALLYGNAWMLVDLPSPEEESLPPTSLADQESAGLLRAYACSLEPECVLDWEVDNQGELEWALLHSYINKRTDLTSARTTVREEWTLYTRQDWTRWFLEYDSTREVPNPDDPVNVLMPTTPHSFGRVPLLRLHLPKGLWLGGKMESTAIAHLNQRAALSWAQLKSLFQFLAIKLGAPNPLNPVTEDTERAVSQPIGPGRLMVLGPEDSVEYVSPQSAPFDIAMKDLAALRDEMFRVVHYMAAAVDQSGASLRRSADSKEQDAAATAVVLRALGQRVREHAVDLYEMVGMGRQDPLVNWRAKGLETFSEETLANLITEEMSLENISIPSATFQVERKRRLALRKLGDDVSPEMAETIEEELKANISNEMYASPAMNMRPTDAAPSAAPTAPADRQQAKAQEPQNVEKVK